MNDIDKIANGMDDSPDDFSLGEFELTLHHRCPSCRSDRVAMRRIGPERLEYECWQCGDGWEEDE